MYNKIWLIVRILSILAFLGFLIVGLLFIISPDLFTGYQISREASIWHSLTLGFMATITVIAFMIAYKPETYWHGLLPLGLGKVASAISSLYWYFIHRLGFLIINTMVDSSIALISLILFLYLLYSKS